MPNNFTGLGKMVLAPCGHTRSTQEQYGMCKLCAKDKKCKELWDKLTK